jgi:hypothetical protein
MLTSSTKPTAFKMADLVPIKLILLLLVLLQQASSECISDYDCSTIYHPNSKCTVAGICSNPYVSGCLHSLDATKHKMRVCNADDMRLRNFETKNGKEQTCRIAEISYPEIRVHNQDWEVALFFSWIYQIVLSEVLNVPVRVGLGRTSANLTTKESLQTSNFYSLETALPTMDGPSYPWHGIRKANDMGGDCSLTQDDCFHVMPDVWIGQRDNYEREYADGQIDYLDGNGQVGKSMLVKYYGIIVGATDCLCMTMHVLFRSQHGYTFRR